MLIKKPIRILSLLTAFAAVILLTAAYAFCADPDTVYTEGTLYYRINGESITITGCFGRNEEVTVPAMIAGYPVNAIAKGAFVSNAYIRKLNLPDTISRIDDGAIPEGVKVIYNANTDHPQETPTDLILYGRPLPTKTPIPTPKPGQPTEAPTPTQTEAAGRTTPVPTQGAAPIPTASATDTPTPTTGVEPTVTPKGSETEIGETDVVIEEIPTTTPVTPAISSVPDGNKVSVTMITKAPDGTVEGTKQKRKFPVYGYGIVAFLVVCGSVGIYFCANKR